MLTAILISFGLVFSTNTFAGTLSCFSISQKHDMDQSEPYSLDQWVSEQVEMILEKSLESIHVGNSGWNTAIEIPIQFQNLSTLTCRLKDHLNQQLPSGLQAYVSLEKEIKTHFNWNKVLTPWHQERWTLGRLMETGRIEIAIHPLQSARQRSERLAAR